MRNFKGRLENSPQGISLNYDNPHDFLHDVTRGVIPPDTVTLEQWLVAHAFAMLDNKLPDMHTSLMIGGQMFGMHHCIQSIHFPNKVRPLMENEH